VLQVEGFTVYGIGILRSNSPVGVNSKIIRDGENRVACERGRRVGRSLQGLLRSPGYGAGSAWRGGTRYVSAAMHAPRGCSVTS